MELERVDSIWYRQLNPGDFFTIERSDAARPAGGGGQAYIDIPGSLRDPLFQFLHQALPPTDTGPWPTELSIEAHVVGEPERHAPITFAHRGGQEGNRYRIANQRRQGNNPGRHPAWTSERGFPSAPDQVATTEEAAASLPAGGVRLYVVRTTDGKYYAGFTQGSSLPDSWPPGNNLERLFDDAPGGRLVFEDIGLDTPPVVGKIFAAWKRKPNVLLYGPPGTGKTHAMSVVRRLLELGIGAPIVGIDPSDRACPFKPIAEASPLPTPVVQDWLSFHQNYSYEDFILGLRPKSASTGGFDLKPRIGKLLELALQVSRAEEPAESAVLFIDEVNRGNVSRIFGEFITYMEFDYRDKDAEGNSNLSRIPVTFPSVDVDNGLTEELERQVGAPIRVAVPWFFPRHVYTLSSMNSVDRTVAPLDSALSRRIERIELAPDSDLLARRLGVTRDALVTKVREYVETRADGAPVPELTPAECSWLLFDRINQFLSTTLGPDFEIGHTYFFDVAEAQDENTGFSSLAIIWDRFIYPQLQERFVVRPEELLTLLRVGEAHVPNDYAFRARTGLFSDDPGERPTVQGISLGDLAVSDPERLKKTLRYLACP